MRAEMMMLLMLMFSAPAAPAQASVGIGPPTESIGFNVQSYPELLRVPGYPVYYAAQLPSNYFFHDGMYWVYQGDDWFASSWYNGPWGRVARAAVPLSLLRIPVRYYRKPPEHFRGWPRDAPPHWAQQWGPGWEQQRKGWETWNRRAEQDAAMLPAYQRKYSGSRYPQVEEQRALHSRKYDYRPHDAAIQEFYRRQKLQVTAELAARQDHGESNQKRTVKDRDRNEESHQDLARVR